MCVSACVFMYTIEKDIILSKNVQACVPPISPIPTSLLTNLDERQKPNNFRW